MNSLLQSDLKLGRNDRFVYWAFDLLHLDGHDLTKAPLEARKAALQRLLRQSGRKRRGGPIRYTEHLDEAGPLVFKHAGEMGLEGIVSKRRDAPYRSGRSENFIKIKCHDRQEFVVAGFSPSAAQPNAVGALTVAFHERGKLRYAGRVGTGYTRNIARDLWKRLEPLRTAHAPVTLPPDERRKDVVWVKPRIVVEAEFRGLTGDGLLRQAAYKGLREDKPAREVVHETPVAAKHAQRQSVRKSPAPKPARKNAKKKDPPAKPERGGKAGVEIANVRLTHPDRIYWPDAGVTKADLAGYYASVWDFMAPHIVGRPLAVLRCPEGTAGECFFQKHIGANIKASPLRHVVRAKEHDVIAVERLDDLIALVQSGALEVHVRGSRLAQLERCDRIVFDLDPGEGVGWKAIVSGAQEVATGSRRKSSRASSSSRAARAFTSWCRSTAPIGIRRRASPPRVASAMAADNPKLYLAKMTKALRHGKIFIDYLRNTREATSVAVYSSRARAGAPVSAPLSWEALARTTGSNQFTVLNLKKHLRQHAWADIGKVRQKLPT